VLKRKHVRLNFSIYTDSPKIYICIYKYLHVYIYLYCVRSHTHIHTKRRNGESLNSRDSIVRNMKNRNKVEKIENSKSSLERNERIWDRKDKRQQNLFFYLGGEEVKTERERERERERGSRKGFSVSSQRRIKCIHTLSQSPPWIGLYIHIYICVCVL